MPKRPLRRHKLGRQTPLSPLSRHHNHLLRLGESSLLLAPTVSLGKFQLISLSLSLSLLITTSIVVVHRQSHCPCPTTITVRHLSPGRLRPSQISFSCEGAFSVRSPELGSGNGPLTTHSLKVHWVARWVEGPNRCSNCLVVVLMTYSLLHSVIVMPHIGSLLLSMLLLYV